MLLIKSFFRKKKTIIFLEMLSIIVSILLLLNSFNSFINKEIDRIKKDNSFLIMFSLNNHNTLFDNEKNIISYFRLLPLNKGQDNNIIYTPQYIEMPNGSIGYESIDYSKIEWTSLFYDYEEYPYILTLPSSYCSANLKDEEVILALEKDIDYQEEYKNNYLNNSINFKYKDESLNLYIKDIIEPKTFNYICISDNLYNSISKKENKYIYLINTNSYSDIEKLENKWSNLEENDYYNIQYNTIYNSIETDEKVTSLSNLSNMLKIADIISIIIFTIIFILVIKDLINDEEKDILLFKQLGFNHNQIIKTILKNIIILDIFIIIISLILSKIISILLNILLNIKLQIFSSFIFIIIIIILLFEFIFLIHKLKSIKS